MKRLEVIMILLTVMFSGACQSTNKNIDQMKMKEKLINSLKNYSENRIYYVNVNKGGCRVELTVNDIF